MKKKKQKQQETKEHPKHKAYIGIATLFAIGLLGINSLGAFKGLLTEDNPVVSIPTAPPLFSVMNLPPEAAPSPKTPAAKAEQTKEPSALPVIAPIEPFSMIPPLAGETLTPYSPEKLLFSRTMGDWRTHPGIDIKADSGTAVMAAAKGTVTRAEEDALMGFTIEIEHEGGYKTLYQNLASCEMVAIGNEVSEGQVIAAVGNSAKAELLEESHLHFALLCGEKYSDPQEFLKP